MEKQVAELRELVDRSTETNRKLLERFDSETADKRAAINKCAKPGCNSRVKAAGGRCRWHAKDETSESVKPVSEDEQLLTIDQEADAQISTELENEDEKPETPEGYAPAPEKAFGYQT